MTKAIKYMKPLSLNSWIVAIVLILSLFHFSKVVAEPLSMDISSVVGPAVLELCGKPEYRECLNLNETTCISLMNVAIDECQTNSLVDEPMIEDEWQRTVDYIYHVLRCSFFKQASLSPVDEQEAIECLELDQFEPN